MARTVFYGHNDLAGGLVEGDPVTQREAFLAALTGVGSEGFESQPLNSGGPFVLTFPGSAGSIGAILQAANGQPADKVRIRNWDGTPETFLGRFNTTPGGTQFLQATHDFEIIFDTPIAAFGFYGTDIGDFSASMQIVLRDSLGNDEVIAFPVPIPANNGALTFWGFIDDAKTYQRITMLIAQVEGGSTDAYGFDDMVVGDPTQAGVPPIEFWPAGCQAWPAGLGTA